MSPPRGAHRLDRRPRSPDDAQRLTSTISRISSSGCSHAFWVRSTPALLTHTFSGPRSAAAAAAARWASGRARRAPSARRARPAARPSRVRVSSSDVRDQHGHAAAGQQARDLAPDAAPCARDHRRVHAREGYPARQGRCGGGVEVTQPASSGRSPMAQTSSRRKKKPPARRRGEAPSPARASAASARKRRSAAFRTPAAPAPAAAVRAGAAGARRDRPRPGGGGPAARVRALDRLRGRRGRRGAGRRRCGSWSARSPISRRCS